jgi:hypothetical protein
VGRCLRPRDRTKDARVHDDWLRSGEAQKARRGRVEARQDEVSQARSVRGEVATFTDRQDEIMGQLALTSTDADTRVGTAINRHYRRITSSLIGLSAARFVTRSVTTNGVSDGHVYQHREDRPHHRRDHLHRDPAARRSLAQRDPHGAAGHGPAEYLGAPEHRGGRRSRSDRYGAAGQLFAASGRLDVALGSEWDGHARVPGVVPRHPDVVRHRGRTAQEGKDAARGGLRAEGRIAA